MEGGALFNPGILGSSFLWWIGQIADDSTWRDNQLTGKFPDKETIPGFGTRYKVRIMGIHDQGETVVPSSELPWANIMYPVTAGGGQTNSWMSSNLRQGNIVFGFWMDGQDMQVPVIMGVMATNSQTALGMKIGKPDNAVSTTQNGSLARSGYADGEVPKTGTKKEKVPDEGLTTQKPVKKDIAIESAPSAPGAIIDQFGLDSARPRTQSILNDIASGRLQAQTSGLTGTAAIDKIKNVVQSGIKNRAGAAKSPSADPEPGPTIESTDNPHQLAAGDVKREDKYQEKVVAPLKQEDAIGSATKSIQIEIDNLTAKVDKFMGSRKEYIDAVSGPPNQNDLDKEIRKTACKVSKFQKIIMDKIGEYQNKKMNNELTSVVAAMPSSLRYMFGDQKFLNTQETVQQYNEITNGMCDQMEGILKAKLNIPQLKKQADALAASGALWADPNSQSAATGVIDLTSDDDTSTSSGSSGTTAGGGNVTTQSNVNDIRTPKVPLCYAEDVVAQGIAVNKQKIQDIASTQHKNYNRFLDGVKSQLDQTDDELKGRSYDKSNLGKVTGFTDEEEDDLPQGGTNYYSENGAPCTGGSGTGLKVDIVVPDGGWYDNSFATINDEGAGYYVDTANGGGVSGTGTTTGISATGGSGSGIKLNFTIASGKITGITTNTAGANYKNGDVLTISQGSQAAINPTTYATFTVDKVRGTVNTVANGGIKISNPGSGYKMGELLVVSQQGSGQNCGVVITQVVDPGEKKATAGPVTPGDTQGSVADSKPPAGQQLGDMLQMLGGMSGNMTQALDFKNLMGNIFPFETPPNMAVSDFYTLARGGAGQPETDLPSSQSIDKAVSKIKDVAPSVPSMPFATPAPNQPSINLQPDEVIGGLGSGLTQEEVDDALKQVEAGKAAGLDSALDMY